jgi:UPF0755 protein
VTTDRTRPDGARPTADDDRIDDAEEVPRNPRPTPRDDIDANGDRDNGDLDDNGVGDPERASRPRPARRSRGEVIDTKGRTEPARRVVADPRPPVRADVALADRAYSDAGIDYADDAWEVLPKRSSFRRRLLTAVAVTAIVGFIGAGLVWRWVQHQIHPPGPEGAPVEFTIEAGAATSEIAADLARKDIIGNPTIFRIWLNRNGGGNFQAGIYDMHEHMDFEDAVAVLRGPARTVTEFRVTIPPGLTVAQIEGRLLAQLQRFSGPELDAALANPEVTLTWAPPGATNREGILFPDTYNLDERTAGDELGLLLRMRDETEKVATQLDLGGRAAALGVSAWQALTIASIVEREAKVDADRAKIARVIYNRLQRDMNLEIDATVLYAVGRDRGLTLNDLQIDSPYNTYKVKGLPPTPIASPSRKSIEATLNPAEGKWLWYVLTDKSGAHTFAETEKAFLAAKEICEREKLCG